jgi:integrase
MKIDDEYYLNKIKNTKFLKENTKKTYLKSFEVIKEIWGDKNCNIDCIIKKPDEYYLKLVDYGNNYSSRFKDKKISIHTLSNYIAPIISLFLHNEELKEEQKDLYEKWKINMDKIRKPVTDKYYSNEPNERQKEAYISYEDIIKIRDKLEVGSFERLLLFMYTAIPPVRSDYYKTQIYKKTPSKNLEDTNYIVLTSKPYLVLNKYKTAAKYKTIIVEIPPELKKEIEESLKIFPRQYLFISRQTKEEYKFENTFNRWCNYTLKKITSKPNFSLTMLRHIFLSRKDLDIGNMTGTEKNKIAMKMGHNIQMQGLYRWIKEIDDEHDE